LSTLAVRLADKAAEYRRLRRPTDVVRVGDGKYLVDLLANRNFLDKCYVGLVAGSFLTIRKRDGEQGKVGEIRDCPLCRVPATQTHFLNICPANALPRETLSQSLPPRFTSALLQGADYSAFYENVRSLEISIVEPTDEGDSIPTEVYVTLARTTSAMAGSFVGNALSLFKQDNEEPL
jgi:hypothetical protein